MLQQKLYTWFKAWLLQQPTQINDSFKNKSFVNFELAQ